MHDDRRTFGLGTRMAADMNRTVDPHERRLVLAITVIAFAAGIFFCGECGIRHEELMNFFWGIPWLVIAFYTRHRLLRLVPALILAVLATLRFLVLFRDEMGRALGGMVLSISGMILMVIGLVILPFAIWHWKRTSSPAEVDAS
jgi:MFS family permease